MKRKGALRFSAFISDQSGVAGTLPMIHTTRAYLFDQMVEGDLIKARHCDLFDEDLVYLFYGRPAYRVRKDQDCYFEFDWPVVFIMDPDCMEEVARIHPFDTGAFKRGYYTRYFDRESDVSDFDVGHDFSMVSKLVGAFFVNNKEYLLGSSRKNVDIPPRNFEVSSVYELAKAPGIKIPIDGKVTLDERSSSVEVQVRKAISIPDRLLAIILPETYLGMEDVREAISRWKPKDIITYPAFNNMSSDSWIGVLYQKVYEFYLSIGVIEKD